MIPMPTPSAPSIFHMMLDAIKDKIQEHMLLMATDTDGIGDINLPEMMKNAVQSGLRAKDPVIEKTEDRKSKPFAEERGRFYVLRPKSVAVLYRIDYVFQKVKLNVESSSIGTYSISVYEPKENFPLLATKGTPFEHDEHFVPFIKNLSDTLKAACEKLDWNPPKEDNPEMPPGMATMHNMKPHPAEPDYTQED